MVDLVQIYNPEGEYVLIDRSKGRIICNSTEMFDESVIPLLTHKSYMESAGGNIPFEPFKEIGPPPVRVEECCIEDNGFVAGRKNWTIPTLLKAVRDQKCRVFDLPLAGIYLGALPWDIKTIDDFIYHADRAHKVDLLNPIIIDWKGFICDGWHRVVKAIVLRQPTIRAYRLKEWVKPDFDGGKPDGDD